MASSMTCFFHSQGTRISVTTLHVSVATKTPTTQKENLMFDWKTILMLSFVVLGLVVVLAHREMTKPVKAPRVEYKFMNLNF